MLCSVTVQYAMGAFFSQLENSYLKISFLLFFSFFFFLQAKHIKLGLEGTVARRTDYFKPYTNPAQAKILSHRHESCYASIN